MAKRVGTFADMQRIFYAFWIVVVIVGCGTNSFENRSGLTVIDSMKPLYAKGFEILTMSDSSYRILLFNLQKAGDTLQVINWKRPAVNRLACLSTTHIAFIDQLNGVEKLKGTGFADLVKNKNTAAKIAKGEIINLSVAHDIDDEKVLSIDPELFFVYPFGGTDYRKFLSKGIGCVQVSEYLETSPLGRAEWIKLFGALLGEEQMADSIFDTVKMRYESAMQLVKKSNVPKPTVFTGSYDNGNWFAPSGNSFAATLLKDAGAQYVFADSITDGNLIVPFEQLLFSVYNTDFWGKIMMAESEVTSQNFVGKDERLTHLKSYSDGNLFYCNTQQCDYHGDAVMEPDVMLKDLIKIFHHGLLPEHQSVYFIGLK